MNSLQESIKKKKEKTNASNPIVLLVADGKLLFLARHSLIMRYAGAVGETVSRNITVLVEEEAIDFIKKCRPRRKSKRKSH